MKLPATLLKKRKKLGIKSKARYQHDNGLCYDVQGNELVVTFNRFYCKRFHVLRTAIPGFFVNGKSSHASSFGLPTFI